MKRSVFLLTAGDVYEAEVRADEEGLRVERVVRLRDPRHHLQLAQQTLPGLYFNNILRATSLN